MDTLESLSHSVWECKYHVVFIPKCRRKTLLPWLRQWVKRGRPTRPPAV
jgi:putative transposase